DFVAPSTSPTSTLLAVMAEASRVAEAKARLVDLGIEESPQKLLWSPSVVLTAYRRAIGERESFTVVDAADGGALVARIEAGRVVALRIIAPCDDDLLLRNITWSLAAIPGDALRTFVGG